MMAGVYGERVKGLEDVLYKVLAEGKTEVIGFPTATKIAAKLYGVKEDPTAADYVKRLSRETRKLKSSNIGFKLPPPGERKMAAEVLVKFEPRLTPEAAKEVERRNPPGDSGTHNVIEEVQRREDVMREKFRKGLHELVKDPTKEKADEFYYAWVDRLMVPFVGKP